MGDVLLGLEWNVLWTLGACMLVISNLRVATLLKFTENLKYSRCIVKGFGIGQIFTCVSKCVEYLYVNFFKFYIAK